MYIIGYIHVCQRGDWRRSFSLLINAVKNSQLYDNVNIIRIGVVNDVGAVMEDPLLKDAKFEVLYLGASAQYERPTLLHMRAQAENDPVDTVYFYLHTKGIKHFGTNKERNVIGWINLMLYWNIVRWRYATEILKTYNIYGCDYLINHFSGNFWWATAKHIQKLPKTIASYYVAPEFWVTLIKEKLYSAYCSDYAGGGLYLHYLPPEKYNKLSNAEAHKTNLQAYNHFMKNQNKSSINMQMNTAKSSRLSNVTNKLSKLTNVSNNVVSNNVVSNNVVSNNVSSNMSRPQTLGHRNKPNKFTIKNLMNM
jgi:hypothetical protein